MQHIIYTFDLASTSSSRDLITLFSLNRNNYTLSILRMCFYQFLKEFCNDILNQQLGSNFGKETRYKIIFMILVVFSINSIHNMSHVTVKSYQIKFMRLRRERMERTDRALS